MVLFLGQVSMQVLVSLHSDGGKSGGSGGGACWVPPRLKNEFRSLHKTNSFNRVYQNVCF